MEDMCKDSVCKCQRDKLTIGSYLLGCLCIFVMVLTAMITTVILAVYLTEYNKTTICTCDDTGVNIGDDKSDRSEINIQPYRSKEGSIGTSKTDCEPVSWLNTCKACFSLKQQDV